MTDIIKIWTVQDIAVLNKLLMGETYFPDLEKSSYFNNFPEELRKGNQDLYSFLLSTSNRLNQFNSNGLVFAFSKIINLEEPEYKNYVKPGSIDSIEEFQQFIADNQSAIKSIWDDLSVPGKVILELMIDLNSFYFLPIDINDYQCLMPPINLMGGLITIEDINDILDCIKSGHFSYGHIIPSKVAQLHLPVIFPDQLIGAYPVFKVSK
ncbi:hypothetical protein [Ligilactobacillus agilis]|uniref:hypothetical protein n=1 Tax=Ligilactobacillus agilis TaxID=1601 RepID=UPI00255D06CE|nr:hypothetical protein [Ligilactobacillus agilis]